MSTRSWISIEINPEDVGTYRHHNPKLLPMKLEVDPHRKHAKNNFPMVELSKFLGIYCHSDGYPCGVGKTLLKHYNTYEKALNLILGGDYSCLVGSRHLYPNLNMWLKKPLIRSYFLVDWCDDYGKERSSSQIWAGCKPRTFKTMKGADPCKVYPKGHDIEWAYLWKDNKWWVKECCLRENSSGDWVPLTEENTKN